MITYDNDTPPLSYWTFFTSQLTRFQRTKEYPSDTAHASVLLSQSTNCKANSNNRWRSSFVALAADIFGRGITLVFRRYFAGNRVWWVGEGKTGGIDSIEYMGRPTFTRNKHPSRLVYRDRVQVTGVPEAQTMGWVGNLKWRTRTSETPCSYARTAPRFQGDGIELD